MISNKISIAIVIACLGGMLFLTYLMDFSPYFKERIINPDLKVFFDYSKNPTSESGVCRVDVNGSVYNKGSLAPNVVVRITVLDLSGGQLSQKNTLIGNLKYNQSANFNENLNADCQKAMNISVIADYY